MMIEELLARLTKVKAAGPGKWISCCSAHEDRSPSLAIKEADGTILLHCFAGCSIEDICGSIGVEVTELFPPRRDEWQPGAEKPMQFGGVRFTALDALRCLAGEAGMVLQLACDQAEGRILSPTDIDRVATAVGRLNASLDYLGQNPIERPNIT
jgi:hypothetical protein